MQSELADIVGIGIVGVGIVGVGIASLEELNEVEVGVKLVKTHHNNKPFIDGKIQHESGHLL